MCSRPAGLGGGRIPLLGQTAEVELLLRLSAELAAEQRSLLPVEVDGTSDAEANPPTREPPRLTDSEGGLS
jgi:hypothetical protein